MVGKKVILAFLPLFVIVPLYAESRVVRMGVFKADPMVTFDDGKAGGLFVDLAEYFANELDWQLEYVEGTWSEQLERLEKGEIDLLPAVSYTEERTEIFDFSNDPIFIDSGVLYTGPGVTIHTIFELQGRKVAALEGSVFTAGFTDYIASFGISCELILMKDNVQVMKALTDGKADAGVTIYSLGSELSREFPVRITPISFSPRALHFAVPKGRNHDLVDGINRVMSNMLSEKDSFYSRAVTKWTSSPAKVEIPAWIKIGAAFLVFSGILLLLWIFTLRRQVRKKTKDLEEEIAERTGIERKLKSSISDKEMLIRELYHRTRNSMQTISGIMVLQANEHESEELFTQLVKNTDSRIQAMSLVHQMLYSSKDLSRISLKHYVEELSILLLNGVPGAGKRIVFNIEISPEYLLQLDTAIPFGLILNELIMNSLSYAFPEGGKGEITINIDRSDSGYIQLDYSDNGTGLPEGFDFSSQASLGIKLILEIGEMQLHGKVEFLNYSGLRCRVGFSEELYLKRI